MVEPVTATAAFTLSTVLSAVASAGQAIYGIASVKDYLAGCTTRAMAGRRLPGNHDLVRGNRTAHLCAIDHVARAHAKALADLPHREQAEDEEPFQKNIRAFIDERLKLLKQAAVDHDVLTTEAMLHAMDGLIHPETVEGFGYCSKTYRSDAENQALAELEKDAGRSAPPLFKRLFLGPKGAGWHDAYRLYVTEELKTNERFRNIFMAAKAVDSSRAIAALQDHIDQALKMFPDLVTFQNSVSNHLSRIENKVDAVKDDTTKILEMLARDKGISLETARPVFEHLGLQYLSSFEMLEQADAAFDAIIAKANAAVTPSNQGADIDAAIDASRKALRAESNAAAVAILQNKLAEEEQTQFQRLAPLLLEKVDMHKLVFNWQAAIATQQQLLALIEAAHGSDHPETAQVLDTLATLYQTRGDYPAAKPLFIRALAIAENSMGPEHPSTGIRLNNLAGLLRAEGDYDGAKPLYKRALTITEKSLGPEHPSTGIRLNNLAGLLRAQGDYDGAKPLFERALVIAEKSLGPEHPSTGTCLNNLAELLRAQGNYDGAKPLYKRALVIAEKSLGPEHPSTGTNLNNLAGLQRAQGDYDSAKQLYERALAITEKALGPEHPNTKVIRRNLSELQKRQKES